MVHVRFHSMTGSTFHTLKVLLRTPYYVRNPGNQRLSAGNGLITFPTCPVDTFSIGASAKSLYVRSSMDAGCSDASLGLRLSGRVHPLLVGYADHPMDLTEVPAALCLEGHASWQDRFHLVGHGNGCIVTTCRDVLSGVYTSLTDTDSRPLVLISCPAPKPKEELGQVTEPCVLVSPASRHRCSTFRTQTPKTGGW
jgi:hypothetical protein